MTEPRRRPGRRKRLDPSRPVRNHTVRVHDDQWDWLESKMGDDQSVSTVLRDLIDRVRQAERLFERAPDTDSVRMANYPSTEGPQR